jgi:lipooligosaccharide transport system permease protein
MRKDTPLSWRFLRVWQRNLIVHRRIWQVNFLVPLLEPIFYIMAFGLGLGGLVGDVDYAGQSMDYVAFIAPALVATAAMWNSFFETTYASFVRMYYQKTFDGLLATPLSLEEVVVAEVVWGATKSAAAAGLMTIMLALLGYAQLPMAMLAVPLAFVGGMAFGALGIYFTGIMPSIDMYNLPIFLFITPMFLFSGTFFPVAGLPDWARTLAEVMPLYHLAELTRGCLMGRMEANPIFGLAYLLAFAAVFLWLGVRAMKKRMIN